MNSAFRNGVALTVLLIAATPVWAQAPATSPAPSAPAQTQPPAVPNTAAPNTAAPEQAAPANKENPAAAMHRPGRPQMSRSMARGHGYGMRHRWQAGYARSHHAYRAHVRYRYYPSHRPYGWQGHYGWRRWCRW